MLHSLLIMTIEMWERNHWLARTRKTVVECGFEKSIHRPCFFSGSKPSFERIVVDSPNDITVYRQSAEHKAAGYRGVFISDGSLETSKKYSNEDINKHNKEISPTSIKRKPFLSIIGRKIVFRWLPASETEYVEK